MIWGGAAIVYWLLAVGLHQRVQQYFSLLAAQWGFDILQYRILLFWWLAGIIGFVILYVRHTSMIKPHKKSLTFCVWTIFFIVLLGLWFTFAKTRAESIHFVQYALLFVVFYQAYSRLLLTSIVVSFLGLLDESLQAYLTTQPLDLVDVGFNALGSIAGALGMWQWKGQHQA